MHVSYYIFYNLVKKDNRIRTALVKQSLKFIKRRILVTCCLVVVIGSLYAGAYSFKSFLAIFVLIAWYLHAASSNDYADRKIDEINLKGHTDRPLVNNSISSTTLWAVHALSGIVALVLSAIYGLNAILLTIVVLLIDYAYSFKPIRITDRGFISQLILPIAYVVYPLSLGYWSVNTAKPYPWLLLLGLYTGFIARLMLKDFRDVKGDKMFGKLTFLIRHGRLATCCVSELFAFISLMIINVLVHFSIGPFIVLLTGHVFASWCLNILSKTSSIQKQVKIVKLIAKIANGSVIIILTYYLTVMTNASHSTVNLAPLLIGLAWYLYVWRSSKNDIQTKFA